MVRFVFLPGSFSSLVLLAVAFLKLGYCSRRKICLKSRVHVHVSATAAVDFSPALLFPGIGIKEVFCSVQSEDGLYIGHSIGTLPANSLEVRVVLSRNATSAVVTCTVDQSTRTHAAH